MFISFSLILISVDELYNFTLQKISHKETVLNQLEYNTEKR